MAFEILMPALSPTMTEGTLVKWRKKEGDFISYGDVLVEIETDKATMEVEAVEKGYLGKISVPEGTKNVSVNQVIGLIIQEGENIASLEISSEKGSSNIDEEKENNRKGYTTTKSASTPLARRIAEERGLDISDITGTGPKGKITRKDVEATIIPTENSNYSENKKNKAETIGLKRTFASPLARRLAKEASLSLDAISGTGPGGRILKTDVENAKIMSVKSLDSNEEVFSVAPLSSMQRVIADRMTRAKENVPHFYLTVDCEIDELLKVRSTLNQGLEGHKLSINDFVIRACALALMEVPSANVCWEGEGNLRFFNCADISIAVALETGLITPILRSAELKGLSKISFEMRKLATKAKEGKLTPQEFQGGSFTISNLGMFGIKQFEAIINEPQGSILAVGAAELRPTIKNDEVVAATLMSCTLSCDHRMIDGALGAKLLGVIKRLLEYPPEMLL